MKKILIIFILISSFGLNAQDLKLRENYNTELTYIIGSLVSSNIYLSYLSIDMISKEAVEGDLDKKKEERLIKSLNSINSHLETTLKQLYSITESDDDAKMIFKLVNIVQQLKLDNQNLIIFIEDKNQSNLDSFNDSHMKVWKNLSDLSK